jgi:hypothetical protein
MNREDGANIIDYEAKAIMLQLQVEQLESELEKELQLHGKSNARARSFERKNSKLQKQLDEIEGDMNILAQCWACKDLGNRTSCCQCSNSAVFQWNGNGFEWRGHLK